MNESTPQNAPDQHSAAPVRSPQEINDLVGQKILAVSTTTDENGVTAIHLLGDQGRAVKIVPGEPGYLGVGGYQGWRLRG